MPLIKINGKRLDICDEYKYLGVIFDSHLTWKPHIDRVCNKVSKACGALSKLRHCVDLNTLKNVYYALVHSYLRYGVIAWGNAIEKKQDQIECFTKSCCPNYDFCTIWDWN